MSKHLIVITGGPGTGKTTLINALLDKGFNCFPEISREITQKAKEQGISQLFLKNPVLFSQLILEGRKKQYEEALNATNEIVFLDRGIPDVLAYLNYIGDSYPSVFDQACREHRYESVFLLPPWEAIYSSDDHRYENFEQAKLIYNHLNETYQNFGYQPIEVPQDTVANRILYILDKISI